MAYIWKRAAHSVNNVFSLVCLPVVCFHFTFEGGNLVLIASVPDKCLSFIF